jgi:Zn-dependent peptidase ImmA (M78 family)/O-acetyl-ADP-ribose deacetylase (regulator of RNase III)
MSPAVGTRWTNPSVRALARDGNAVETISSDARTWVYRAREAGWAGPPFDPIELADLLGVEVIAVEGVADARLVHIGRRPRIEFNPSRPRARVRFSIAHELGHLLFPDAADKVRYRSHSDDRRRDDWQVELLCNFAAAEFLMPVGSLPASATTDLEINHLMRLRARFEVSAEALLLRVIDLTAEPAAAFAAARFEDEQPRFRIDYCVAGRAWRSPISADDVVHGRPLTDCTAIEHTAKGEMTFGERLHVECVGVPGYPGQRYPRVIGILRPRQRVTRSVSIDYVDGDATAPRGDGPWMIAQVVNDKAATWGGRGFAAAIRAKYPEAQEQFRDWGHNRLELGTGHLAELGSGRYVFSMVAQHGYGPAPRMRLRYGALERCLVELGARAAELGAAVHMPLIGTGQAGGDWGTIEELIYTSVCRQGVAVTVYVPPGAALPDEHESQLSLSF